MKVKENKKLVVTEALKEFGEVAIEAEELHDLKSELVDYKTNFEARVNAEVGKTRGIMESKHKADLELATSKNNEANAKLKAEFDSSKEQIKFLDNHINTLNKQIAEERNARVSIAQAQGNPSVVVNTTGK